MNHILIEAILLSIFIKKHHCLPPCYITKQAATRLGWKGGSLDAILPGMAIGGDVYHNRSGALPKGAYQECDLGTVGSRSRGACRLVISSGYDFFLTLNHYHSFIRIYV